MFLEAEASIYEAEFLKTFDRKLTLKELATIAAYHGDYMVSFVNLSEPGPKTDFYCHCINRHYPLWVSECNDGELEALKLRPLLAAS